jgi:hypothetical protein
VYKLQRGCPAPFVAANCEPDSQSDNSIAIIEPFRFADLSAHNSITDNATTIEIANVPRSDAIADVFAATLQKNG